MVRDAIKRQAASEKYRYDMADPEKKVVYDLNFDRLISRNSSQSTQHRAHCQVYEALKKGWASEKDLDDIFFVLFVLRSSPRCYYCGDPPTEVDLSVDRMDSNKTYMQCIREGLLVPAHSFCNIMKHRLSVDNFFLMATNVVKYQDYGIAAAIAPAPKKHKQTFERFQHSAKIRHRIELTESDFEKLSTQPCHHCGVMDPNGSGIDRMQNEIGYIRDNCYPSCWACNRAKHIYTADLLYNVCRKIVRQHNLI